MRSLILLAVAGMLTAAELPRVKPEEAGVSGERLRRVHALLERYIGKGEIAGSVAVVARKGKVVHFEAQGMADLATKQAMAEDQIFRLASMTKPVTSLAVMMLHEEGRFLLDDPLANFLPEFANMQVAVANAPHERAPAGYRLVPAERPITIRHLLTHTAGLASGTAGPTMGPAIALAGRWKPTEELAEVITRLSKLPLNFQPGTAWEYGPSVDVLGRLVEVVSGMPLDRFFRERIFDPLGMKDTWFYVPDAQLGRLATNYRKKDGKLEKYDSAGPETRGGRYFAGGGGLAGTARDYLRFCQMLLNGGELDGKRLVSRKTVEAMTVNQIGELPLWQETHKSYGFGLGFRVRKDLAQSPTLGSVGEYGWGGAHGTYFWIDPKEQMIGILMIQLNPYAHLQLRPEFQNAVTQAIVD